MPLASAASQCAQAIVAALSAGNNPIPPDAASQKEALNKWTTVVDQIFTTIIAEALVLPIALVSPTGPVTGTGTIS